MERILPSIPLALEQVFSRGALLISYVEGDALVEFAVDKAQGVDQQSLEKIAQLAVTGLLSMSSDYGAPLYEVPDDSTERASAFQLCLGVVLCISGITFWYGNSILPLNWLSLSGSSFAVVFLLGCIFLKFTRRLFESGKLVTISFFCCSAVLLMLLIGVVSREFYSSETITQEGIIESLFEGSPSKIMRIRLASQPHKTYVLSKEYLTEMPEKLPQAIRVQILVGLFGARYVDSIALIR